MPLATLVVLVMLINIDAMLVPFATCLFQMMLFNENN
jgi:hypothetical protein